MKKKSARSRYSLLIFISILLVICLGLFYFRFRHAYSERRWNEESEFIVFNTNSLEIKIYTPNKERIRTYKLPLEAYIEVPEGYGFYKIKDIPALSRVERRAEELVVRAVSSSFGIPFDASTTTLTEWDKLLIWYANWVYEEKDYVVDLTDAPLFVQETRVDGVEIQKVSPEKVDGYLQHELWEKAIVDDNLMVGIFNASGEPNIASSLSRKLENIGVRVIETSNWQEEMGNGCEMRIKAIYRESYTARRLLRLFDCQLGEVEPLSRFDVMVITKWTL